MKVKACQLCGAERCEVIVDGATRSGPWAYMCVDCHKEAGYGLGIGRGQMYKLDPTTNEYVRVPDEIRGTRQTVTQPSTNNAPLNPRG